MNFHYTVKTNKDFDQVVELIEKETVKAGFKVLHIHDVQKTIGAKGFKIKSYKIIEICNAKAAYQALKSEPKIGLFLPCKINVYIKASQTHISGMRPIVLPQFFPKADLGSLLQKIDTQIKNIINKAIQ